jgi:two-component system sensor histidine kinase VicK
MNKNVDSVMLELLREDARSVFAFDLSSNDVVYINKSLQRFLSALNIPVSAANLLNIVHHQDRDFLVERYQKLKPGCFLKDIKFRILARGQKQVWIRLNLYLNTNPSEPVLTGYLEDISTYKAEVSRLNDFADKKSAVLNILTHDLAGPLGNIQMFSDFITDKIGTIEDQELHYLTTMISQISKQGISLIRDYVDGEFMDSAEGELVLTRVDIVKPLKNLLGEYQQSKKDKGLIFSFMASDEELFTYVDKPKFLQAVNNLLSNAVKFTPPGGKIAIELAKQGSTTVISIKDTGIGIPEKYHATLFEKFNSARRPGLDGQPSIGLGMSIVKTIVDWHNGELWFESDEKSGSVFYIQLNNNR